VWSADAPACLPRVALQEVESLHQFTDLSRIDQVAAHIRRIKKDLAECDEEARRFNSRESLFGKEITEYSQLTDVQKAFEPYCDLWENADNWTKGSKKWMNDAFMTLDAEKIERDVTAMAKNLTKAFKFFEKAGLDGCLQIAKAMKIQVTHDVKRGPGPSALSLEAGP
jgi:dynein heavy chain, axonemal